jgi:hypothetical protein
MKQVVWLLSVNDDDGGEDSCDPVIPARLHATPVHVYRACVVIAVLGPCYGASRRGRKL